MANNLPKVLVDLLYGVGRAKANSSRSNPTETILAADASKGIMTSGEKGIKRGLDWITSQRAVVFLTDKKIKCAEAKNKGRSSLPIWHAIQPRLDKTECSATDAGTGTGKDLDI